MHPDRDALRVLAEQAFPDRAAHAHVDDALIDALIAAMRWRYHPSFAALGIDTPAGAPTLLVPSPATATAARAFYVAHARHTRDPGRDPVTSEFVGHLPMVRVALPAVARTQQTAMGDVGLDEMLLPDLVTMGRYFAFYGDPAPAHVEVVTAPRVAGRRFAAVGVYLCYAYAGDAAPSSYVLEAGLAQGAPRVTFRGRSLADVIEQPTGYTPTPMSSPEHWYRGSIAMDGDELRALTVDVSKTRGVDPYVRVHVDFERRVVAPANDPGMVFLEAVERMALLTQNLGIALPGVPVIVRDALALAAKTLLWERQP